MTEHYEPWLAKLGLIGEVRSSPLRRKPNARQLNAEHDKDLSGEQFGRVIRASARKKISLCGFDR